MLNHNVNQTRSSSLAATLMILLYCSNSLSCCFLHASSITLWRCFINYIDALPTTATYIFIHIQPEYFMLLLFSIFNLMVYDV